MTVQNVLARIAAGIFVIASLMTLARADDVDLRKLSEQVRNPTVQVVMPDEGGLCSGTVVYSDFNKAKGHTAEMETIILTAEHCVSSESGGSFISRHFRVLVPFYDNKTGDKISEVSYIADIVSQGSDTNDLALLRFADKQDSLVNVAYIEDQDFNPTFGEQVFASGFTFGRGEVVSEGRYSGREDANFPDKSSDIPFFRASASIAGGNSGGGLFHIDPSGNYRLIGVADWLMGKQPSTVASYTPIDRVYKFLSSYDDKIWPAKKAD